MNEIDNLAQLIRQVDGDHTMSAGELAEHIIGDGYRKAEFVRLRRELVESIAICEEGNTPTHTELSKLFTGMLEGNQ